MKDFDDTNMSFMENTIHLVVQPFTHIYIYICNLSFSTDIFPHTMKIVIAISIDKTGARGD